jgi:integrase
MGRGHVEPLPSGRFRAVVYAGKDPVTDKKIYLKETLPSELLAIEAQNRLLGQVEAGTHPNRSATVTALMKAWMEVADHELTTRETTASYVRRVIDPALGDWLLRKLQYRVDVIDRLYKHLGRCGALCDGRPFIEHKRDGDHDCAQLKCRSHVCKPLSPSTVRRIHGILSPALSYAVSWGWMEKNPAEYAHPPPKLKRRRAKPPTDEKVARLLNLAWATSIEFAMFLWLATTTGARRGELVGLRWTAVNLRAGIITIEKKLRPARWSE